MSSAVAQQLASTIMRHPSITSGMEWVVCNGERWLRITLRGMVPLDPLEAEDYEVAGVWMPSGTSSTVFHATRMQHLIGGTHLAPGSGGILSDGGLRAGQNGHGNRYGVFVHEEPQGAAFYVMSSRPQWPSEPMAIVEARALCLRKVKGGMAGRYSVPAAVGQQRRNIAVEALWLLGSDVVTIPPCPPPRPPTSSSSPPPPPVAPTPPPVSPSMKPTRSPAPLVSGIQGLASWTYSGIERKGNQIEGGYLKVKAGQRLRALSCAEPGEAHNLFSHYVFAENETSGERGWMPTLVFHQPGCGVAGFVHGLVGDKSLNGQSGKIVGVNANERLVLQLPERQVAVRSDNLRIVDGGLEVFDSRKVLLKFHPDKGGDADAFQLARWLVNL